MKSRSPLDAASRYLLWNSLAEPLLPPASYAAQKCTRSEVTTCAAAGSIATSPGPGVGNVASDPPHAAIRKADAASRAARIRSKYTSQRAFPVYFAVSGTLSATPYLA